MKDGKPKPSGKAEAKAAREARSAAALRANLRRRKGSRADDDKPAPVAGENKRRSL